MWLEPTHMLLGWAHTCRLAMAIANSSRYWKGQCTFKTLRTLPPTQRQPKYEKRALRHMHEELALYSPMRDWKLYYKSLHQPCFDPVQRSQYMRLSNNNMTAMCWVRHKPSSVVIKPSLTWHHDADPNNNKNNEGHLCRYRFKIDSKQRSTGIGIGLALTKELIHKKQKNDIFGISYSIYSHGLKYSLFVGKIIGKYLEPGNVVEMVVDTRMRAMWFEVNGRYKKSTKFRNLPLEELVPAVSLHSSQISILSPLLRKVL